MGKGHVDYEEERARDLWEVYRISLAMAKYIRLNEVYADISEWPARRFYVSEERAYRVVKMMLRGKGLHGMHPLKQAMFRDICNRVVGLHKRHPEKSIRTLCRKVVLQSAPRFYLSSSAVKNIILKHRKTIFCKDGKRQDS